MRTDLLPCDKAAAIAEADRLLGIAAVVPLESRAPLECWQQTVDLVLEYLYSFEGVGVGARVMDLEVLAGRIQKRLQPELL